MSWPGWRPARTPLRYEIMARPLRLTARFWTKLEPGLLAQQVHAAAEGAGQEAEQEQGQQAPTLIAQVPQPAGRRAPPAG